MAEQRNLAAYFWGICLALLFSGFLAWLFYFRHIEYTDDAYVQGNQVYITPLHPGFVTSIHTDDSFLAKRGQLLVTLDQTDARIALERAQETLAQTVRQVCELFHQLVVYRKEIDLKTAELIRDAQDYLHRHEVFRQQGVSIEDYEHSIAALEAKYASLEISGALYHKILATIQNTSIRNHPLVVAASDEVRDAWVRLYRCNIYSPVEGLVAQRTIQVGMWVPAGQPLMSVIPLDQIWVNANYKETQLKSMRLGQKIDITADLWGIEQVFHGTIVGLPGGAGNAFSLLPPQNLSGNWIKIVQRLPVRVALDPEEIKRHPLRVGLTCRALVDTRDQSGRMVPDTTAGSPLYQTPIFEIEEKGDQEFIESIVTANLDPLLSDYADRPLDLPTLTITLPPLLQEAFRKDAELQNEVLKVPKTVQPSCKEAQLKTTSLEQKIEIAADLWGTGQTFRHTIFGWPGSLFSLLPPQNPWDHSIKIEKEPPCSVVATKLDPLLSSYTKRAPELSVEAICLPPLLKETLKQKAEWEGKNLRP